MRRLTLILSDLFLPDEVTGNAAQALPAFEWLLRFGGEPEPIDDWRRWLTRELGLAALGELPVAEVAGRAWLPPGADGGTWLATPLGLSARLDHVRLDERGLLRIDSREADALSREFAGHFAPRFRLHPAGERAFMLTGMNPAATTTLDPARLLGSDIGESLPRGAGSAELRRLGAEVEMWLHQSPVNELRAKHGRPRITGLWFWGGAPRAAGSLQEIPQHLADVKLHGGDAFLAGVSVTLGQGLPTAPPGEFAGFDAAIEHHVIEFLPMTGEPHESLASLDTRWFAAARHALASGALSELVVVANDRVYRLSRRSRWRVWRPRRGWLENLARPSRNPKA